MLRTAVSEDDGRECCMADLMSFKSLEPESDAMQAHHEYARFIVPFLLRHGGHPVFIGDVQGGFIHPENVDDRDQLALVRYRSRRDWLCMAVIASGRDGCDIK